MNSVPDDKRIQEQAREAFIAGMKDRIEQAQASGQSPEQIKQQVAAYANAEARRQVPQIVSRFHSWWLGFRRFLIVAALASGVAIGLALFVEHRYAAPLCEQYAAQHGLLYQGFSYPVKGHSSTTPLSGSCLYSDSADHRNSVSLAKLVPSAVIALLVSIALDLEVTIPVAFVFIALIAVGIGRLKR